MDKVIFSSLPIEDLEGMITRAVEHSLSQLLNKNSNDHNDELVTRKQAASLLGISLPTLHDYTKRGVIPTYRIGSRVRFKKVEIIDCLQKVQTKKFRG